MKTFSLSPERASEFVDELAAIRRALDEEAGPADTRHLMKIERWGRLASLLGYATAWIGVNPVSWVAMALGISTRWMIVAHHVLHGGYDRDEHAPARFKSRFFARGPRRWLDWCEWLEPRAWQREHNGLHHYRLGEAQDPDVPERNFSMLRRLPLPRILKYAIFLLVGLIWKWAYYGPNVIVQTATESRGKPPVPYDLRSPRIWSPLTATGRQVWLRSWLPYVVIRFGLLPLPFLALGIEAWRAVLINTLFAELLTNLHTYLVIVPNHAGDDVPRFEAPAGDPTEHLLRQITGSVNYRTGSDLNDFLHGWLNYQIEHHLWPNLTLLQYRRAQPRVKALCARYGVPYRQEPIWRRIGKLADNAVGRGEMINATWMLAQRQ